MNDTQQSRPIRRPVILATAMLIAGAVLLVALRSWLDRPAIDEGSVAALAPQTEEPTPGPEEALWTDEAESAASPGAEVEILPPVVPPTGPIKVVLLPVRLENPYPAAEATFDAVRQAALRALRRIENVEVIDVSAADLVYVVPSDAGTLAEDRLLYLAVSRRFESELVAEISDRSSPEDARWDLRVHVRRHTRGGTSGGRYPKIATARSSNDPEVMGGYAAERIAQVFESVAEANLLAVETRRNFLDTSLAEQDRVRALAGMRAEDLDSEAIAAALDLATRSPSAETRQQIWHSLQRGTYDTSLEEPMSYALLSDLDAAVRKEVAFGLAAYLDAPGSQAVLENAARNDVSPDVRLAARMALMDHGEQQAFKRQVLLDRNLTPAERLAPTVVSSGQDRMPPRRSSDPERAEESLAYAEIISATSEPDLKVRALELLDYNQPGLFGANGVDPAVTRVQIESAGAADDRVRRSALSALRRQAANPEVRRLLETVVEEDPELAAELELAETLARLARGVR